MRARTFVIAVTAGSLLALPLATPASAGVKQHVVCSKVTSSSTKIVGSKITVSSSFGTYRVVGPNRAMSLPGG